MNAERITHEQEKTALDAIQNYFAARKHAIDAMARFQIAATGRPLVLACGIDELPPWLRNEGALAMFKFTCVNIANCASEDEFEKLPFATMCARLGAASEIQMQLAAKLDAKIDKLDGKINALADWLADWRENGSKIDADNPPQGTAAVVRDAILKCWTDYQAAPDNFAPDTIQRGKGQKPSLEECLKFRKNDIIHNWQTLGQLLDAARKKDTEHTILTTFKRLVTSAQRQARRPGK